MKKLIISFLFCTPFFCQSEHLWIVGESYVGHWDYKNPAQYLNVTPTSWSLNSESCELWVTSNTTNAQETLSIDPTSLDSTKHEPVDRLLNETFEKTFFSRSLSGRLEQRSSTGLVEAVGLEIPKTSHNLIATDKQLFLTDYDIDHNRLQLRNLSPQMTETGIETVFSKGELWTAPKMAWDPNAQHLWLGYSAQTHQHIYSPILELRDASGKLTNSHIWPNKGLFFDLCVEEDSSVLTIHDLPSPQFTVPVYSFIERLTNALQPSPVYNVETNYFVDSIQCNRDSLVMLQRSIFGSDGSHIQIWKRGESGIGEKVLKLPGRASKIYSCRT